MGQEYSIDHRNPSQHHFAGGPSLQVPSSSLLSQRSSTMRAKVRRGRGIAGSCMPVLQVFQTCCRWQCIACSNKLCCSQKAGTQPT